MMMMMKRRRLAKHNNDDRGIAEDITSEIFLWLPLQSLVRFKSLSKRCYFLITHKDSYFRRNYFSTLSTRIRNRIVGSFDFHPIIPGFFYQSQPLPTTHDPYYLTTYDRIRFFFFLTTSSSTTTTTTTQLTTTRKYNNNNNNHFSSLDESFDKFSSYVLLHQDPADEKNIYIVASSNGFILCSLEDHKYPEVYCLVNPVTMEWLALPEWETNTKPLLVGFVCKGDYPSLDLVEYTIVRSSWLNKGQDLLFEFFSSTTTGGTTDNNNNNNNKWRYYICSCQSLGLFTLLEKQNPVIVMNDQGAAGRRRIVVCLLVMIRSTMNTGILVFDLLLDKQLGREEDSLKMIATPPGPPRGTSSALQCIDDDYIREFDGVIHYVRLRGLKYFEFWVLNIEERLWRLKHQTRLETMMEGYPWTDAGQFNVLPERCHIHAFHPMNPNLIFLTLYTRMVCYNIETGTLELVQDFFAQNMLDDYNHHVYQWPCWPPLL